MKHGISIASDKQVMILDHEPINQWGLSIILKAFFSVSTLPGCKILADATSHLYPQSPGAQYTEGLKRKLSPMPQQLVNYLISHMRVSTGEDRDYQAQRVLLLVFADAKLGQWALSKKGLHTTGQEYWTLPMNLEGTFHKTIYGVHGQGAGSKWQIAEVPR